MTPLGMLVGGLRDRAGKPNDRLVREQILAIEREASSPALDVERASRDDWPPGLSDGLTLACFDCKERPRFDYSVTEEFWRRWVPNEARLGVVCLPCLDRRCNGAGLAAALLSVQWTGTGHTVVMEPRRRYEYARLSTPEPA